MNIPLTPFEPGIGLGDATQRVVLLDGFAQLKAASHAGETGYYGEPDKHAPPEEVEGRLESSFGSWDLAITWEPRKSNRGKVTYWPEFWVDGTSIPWKDINTGTFFRKEVVHV